MTYNESLFSIASFSSTTIAMNLIIKAVCILSFCGALISASPLEFRSLDTEVQPFAEGDDIKYRLNEDVIPSRYAITLKPFFQTEGTHAQFTFEGEVTITMLTTVATDTITLHAYMLNIESYTLSPYNAVSNSYDNETDKWTIKTSTPIPISTTLTLIVKYTGVLSDDMAGFYRTYYYENGVKVWMGSTQLQSTSARRVFPCFGEI